MPAVSQCAELSAAWALVCILHILATDSLQTLDDKHDSEIVMPPPGLDPPECPVVNVKEHSRIAGPRNASVTIVALDAVELESHTWFIGARDTQIGSACLSACR